MSSKLRSHGKKTVVWILMGMLILGLGGFGVTNFGGNLRSIGSVGETEVSTDQFARSMQGEVRALSERLGQPITMAQAREFGVDRLVQARLFASAAVDEQARIMGVSVISLVLTVLCDLWGIANAMEKPIGSCRRGAVHWHSPGHDKAGHRTLGPSHRTGRARGLRTAAESQSDRPCQTPRRRLTILDRPDTFPRSLRRPVGIGCHVRPAWL